MRYCGPSSFHCPAFRFMMAEVLWFDQSMVSVPPASQIVWYMFAPVVQL